jgi:hypothetical protein
VESMRAISREFLRAGIGIEGLQRALRRSMAEVGEQETRRPGRRSANHSRVSALTGIARKELRATLRSAATESPRNIGLTLPPAFRVMSEWQTNALYQTSTGKPRELALSGKRGSFAELARRVAGDLPATALRLELIRLGYVRKTETGLKLVTKKTAELRARGKRLSIFSGYLGDFANSASFALNSSDQPTRLRTAHRLVDNPKTLAAFEKIFAARAEDLLDGFDQWLSSRSKGDDKKGGSRLGVGIYLIRGDSPSVDSPSPSPSPSRKLKLKLKPKLKPRQKAR